MKKILIILPVFCCLVALGSCGRKTAVTATPEATPATPTEERFDPLAHTFGGYADTGSASARMEQMRGAAPDADFDDAPPARPVAPAARSKSGKQGRNAKPKAEKLYVETDGAQGRVWGYVTMQGDKGSGTIHDWDENTLTVSVTRHGNELFAVDQNSRQYVFRLK